MQSIINAYNFSLKIIGVKLNKIDKIAALDRFEVQLDYFLTLSLISNKVFPF